MCFNTRLGGEWRVTGKRGRTEWREPRVINLRSVQIPLTCRDKDAPFLQVQSEHLPAEGLMTCLGVGVGSALPAPAAPSSFGWKRPVCPGAVSGVVHPEPCLAGVVRFLIS